MALETIRVLIYIDNEALEDGKERGTDQMRWLVKEKTKHFINVEMEILNRHGGGHFANPITESLLRNYDELWVFGYEQVDVPLKEKPRNELTKEEVDTLRRWMDAGNGVLVSGDHSELDPRGGPTTPDTFLGLGMAIGSKIPRAGQLRVWVGPPTSRVDMALSFSSLEGSTLGHLSIRPELQEDHIPQHLTLIRDPVAHELFWWDIDETGTPTPILKLPDHMHEGRVQIPESLNGEWPDPEVKPKIVARGTDKRNNKPYDLIAVYDGHRCGVGRIVADSSWHHYANVNLKGFPRNECGLPYKGSDFDQITQYYVNLVLWLAPASLMRPPLP